MTRQDEPVMAHRIQLHQLPYPTCGSHDLAPVLQCDYYRTAVSGWFAAKPAGRNTILIIGAGPLGSTMHGLLRQQTRRPLNTLNGQKGGPQCESMM